MKAKKLKKWGFYGQLFSVTCGNYKPAVMLFEDLEQALSLYPPPFWGVKPAMIKDILEN